MYLTWNETALASPLPPSLRAQDDASLPLTRDRPDGLGVLSSRCHGSSSSDGREQLDAALAGRMIGPSKEWRVDEDPSRSPKGLVGRGGLEPPTSRLSGVRSNHLSYRPIPWSRVKGPGGACRDRTDDPLLAKQVLSQLS